MQAPALAPMPGFPPPYTPSVAPGHVMGTSGARPSAFSGEVDTNGRTGLSAPILVALIAALGSLAEPPVVTQVESA